MLDEEKEKIYEMIDKEYNSFRNETLKMPPEQIYDSYYVICFYEDFYNYLTSDQVEVDLLSLPKENIFETMYDLFLSKDNAKFNWETYEELIKDNAEYMELNK